MRSRSVTASRNESLHIPLSLLPDGRHFLYLRVALATSGGEGSIYVGSLDARPEEQSSKQVIAGVSFGGFVPSPDSGVAYLLFSRGRPSSPLTPPPATLLAQPFDTRKMELTGEARAIAEQVVGAS